MFICQQYEKWITWNVRDHILQQMQSYTEWHERLVDNVIRKDHIFHKVASDTFMACWDL